MEMKICQSCGMPLTQENYGKNADGSMNEDYCMYCFDNGDFTKEMTVEDMIENNMKLIDIYNEHSEHKMTEEELRAYLGGFIPTLKRWK